MICRSLESIKGSYIMRSLRACCAPTSVLLLGVQSVALAQSLPKYETQELGYPDSSAPSDDNTYVARVVDRAANTLWLCTLSFRHTSPITGGLIVGRNERHVDAKGTFPNLASIQAAQKTTHVGHAAYDCMFLWLVDQAPGDVSVCFADTTTMKYNNKEVGCVPLTHPKP